MSNPETPPTSGAILQQLDAVADDFNAMDYVIVNGERVSMQGTIRQARAEIARLTELTRWVGRDLDEVTRILGNQVGVVVTQAAQSVVDAKESAESALVAARQQIAQLEKFTKHTAKCDLNDGILWSSRERKCTCGLAKVVSRLPQQET